MILNNAFKESITKRFLNEDFGSSNKRVKINEPDTHLENKRNHDEENEGIALLAADRSPKSCVSPFDAIAL